MMQQLDSKYIMLRSSRLMGRAVDVLVGEKKDMFSVHEKLIRAPSPFFDKAMSGPWLESTQRTIELPDDEPPIFAIYVHWLYYGTLPVFNNETEDGEYLSILKAYTLGDKLLDINFQNAAVDAMIEKSTTSVDGTEWYPGLSIIEYVYNNTSESALVRELLVDMYVFGAEDGWLHEWEKKGSIPKPFLFDLAFKLLGQQNRPRLKFTASDYYIHDSKDVEASPDKRGS